MKEQIIYNVVIIQRTEKLHEGSGVVSQVNRKVLFDSKIPAVSQEAAKQKALAGIKDPDFDSLEITCCPFQQ